MTHSLHVLKYSSKDRLSSVVSHLIANVASRWTKKTSMTQLNSQCFKDIFGSKLKHKSTF